MRIVIGPFLALCFGWACTSSTQNSAKNADRSENMKLSYSCTAGPVAAVVDLYLDRTSPCLVLHSGSQDPEVFDPSPAQMNLLLQSKAIFGLGLPFEDKLEQALTHFGKHELWINLAPGIDPTSDPHVWLSPKALLQAMRLLRDVFGHETASSETFIKFLTELDQNWSNELKANPKSFLSLHPICGQVCKDYALNEFALEGHHKEATLATANHAKSFIQTHQLKVMLVPEGQFGHEVDALTKSLNVEPKILPLFSRDLKQILLLFQEVWSNKP